MQSQDQGARGARGEYQGCRRGQGAGEPGRRRGQVICYNCGGPEHYVQDYPNQGDCHATIVLSFTMQWSIVLYC